MNGARWTPPDARNADLLGEALRVERNGCTSETTKPLTQAVFTMLQSRYPKSEWARKYKTWSE